MPSETPNSRSTALTGEFRHLNKAERSCIDNVQGANLIAGVNRNLSDSIVPVGRADIADAFLHDAVLADHGDVHTW